VKSALSPIQQALYTRLTNILSCPVYDAVPQGATFPYVTLGADTGVDWSTKTWAGQEVTITLHTWSRLPGMSQTKDLLDAIVQNVTGNDLVMPEFTPALLRLDYIETVMDPDGVTRHGIVRFRMKISED